MRINNIVFSGVMATILASVVGVASAATVNLASKTYVDDALAQKQNVLTAGEGIEISDNVVKSTIDVSNFLLKHDMPDFNNFAKRSDLAALERALQAEIAAKHAAGDYATAAQLQELKNTVETLQTGGADKAAIESLQASVATISADYAKKSELDRTEQDLRDAIDAVDAAVKAIDLSRYATVDDVDAKLLLKANASALNTLKTTLEAAIAEKQDKGEYLEAEDLTAINTAISDLQSGKADVSAVTALQTAINNLGNTYSTKGELSDVETRLQNAINAIEIPNLSEYAKSADVALTYATKAELGTKADASVLDGLVTSEQLEKLRTDLDAEIAKKQASGDYATATALKAVSDSLAEYAKTSNVYTKAEVDDMIADAISGGQIDLSEYAKTSALEALQALVDDNAAEITKLKNAGYQTSGDVQGAITIATADLATKADLADYAKADDLAEVATTGSYNSLLDKPTIPSIAGLVTSAELQALEDKIAAKQDAGDYLEAEDLTAINTAISDLQSGKADVSAVTALQTAINNLGDNYASDAELTAAINGVKALIPTVPTDVSAFTNDAGYITSAVLDGYATKSEIPSTANLATKAELATKADASALNGLVTSEELETLRTNLEAEIAKKQASGDYATATALKVVSDSLAEYAKTSSVYTKAEVDDMIANAASGGNVDLSGYAKTSALEALQILVNGKQDTIADLATIRAGAEKGATAVQPGAITTGTENGSIAVDGTDVPVKGLGTAAYASVDSLVEKPALPTENGDYMLMVNYADGAHTYSWTNIKDYWREGDDDTNLWD